MISVTFFVMIIFTDAETQEFLQMKIFDRNFRVSESEMHAMLKKANLTGHGYKKEVTMKQRQNADNSKLEYEVLLPFCVCIICTCECKMTKLVSNVYFQINMQMREFLKLHSFFLREYL